MPRNWRFLFAASSLLVAPAAAQTVTKAPLNKPPLSKAPITKSADTDTDSSDVGGSNVAGQAIPPNYVPIGEAYVVEDLDSGRILYSKNPDERLYPASTTKIMTCLVATQRGKLDQVIRASKNAATTGESSIYLIEGEQRSLEDLLRGALIRSANDACVDIAEGLAGSQEQFVDWMNMKARALGCVNTHFMNPHGLHDPDHYTSARDLARIARAVTQVPILNEIIHEKTATIGGNWKIGGNRLLINRNKLLFRWPQCDGMKTGSTKQAGHCLVATATQTLPDGKKWRLLSVVLKSKGNFTYLDSEYLLRKAFDSYAPQQVSTANEVLWSGQVRGGAFPLEAVTSRGVNVPLLKGESGRVTPKVTMLDLPAPLKKGQIVGDVTYYSDGRKLATVTLTARDEVPRTLLAKALPSLGERISMWSLSKKLGIFGVIIAFLATLLTMQRLRNQKKRRRSGKRHVRRHHQSFDSVNSDDL